MEQYQVVVGLGALAAYFIKFLQGSKYFPWITAEAHKITLLVQAFLSLLATLGIGYTWSSATHTLTITGLSFAVIFHGFLAWISQFAIQHGFTNLISLGQTNGVTVGLPGAAVPGKGTAPGPSGGA